MSQDDVAKLIKHVTEYRAKAFEAQEQRKALFEFLNYLAGKYQV